MKRSLCLGLVAVMVAASSGCSIIDRLFLLNVDGPYGHHAGCPGGNCGGNACVDGSCDEAPSAGCRGESCDDGSCDACQACHRPHGRYGGLAKHHLSREEKRALDLYGEGDIGPAGPPTGGVAYPYYTTRGPRDFLAKRPPSIGP